MAKPVVAVIEGDPVIAMLMDELLTDEGFQTHLRPEPQGAAQFIRMLAPDLVILDLWLKDRGDGWRVLDQLRHDRRTQAIPVIVCSGDTAMMQEQEAKLRADGCELLVKPFALADLLALVNAQLEASRPRSIQVPSVPIRSAAPGGHSFQRAAIANERL